ncbi:hypothetical protein OS493_032522 [Desmophyllum pertusum]|uniref:Peptidase C76 domain-containing protein n=1 Tax=Desmophyllum pertusum TaxID=174260 RepID=A0A9W9Z7R8_9CNID|nr:hypothetical protein OS493_032522 [Desmophyllum pertusum]
MVTSVRGSIHQGHEAFNEHSRGRQCAFMSLSALVFNQSADSVDLWTQTNIDDILHHGDRMYLHALSNEMVPDTDNLSINELPKVATSHNNAEYCLDYSKFYQGRIDRSFCDEGPFCSLQQGLMNAFSNSPNAMFVLDGYMMAGIKESEPFKEVLALAPTFSENVSNVTAAGKVVGIISSSQYLSCIKCNKKIEDDRSDIVACHHCGMKQMKETCDKSYYAQIMFQTEEKENLTITLFDKVIKELISVAGVTDLSGNSFDKLLLDLKNVLITYNKRTKAVSKVNRKVEQEKEVQGQ